MQLLNIFFLKYASVGVFLCVHARVYMCCVRVETREQVLFLKYCPPWFLMFSKESGTC